MRSLGPLEKTRALRMTQVGMGKGGSGYLAAGAG